MRHRGLVDADLVARSYAGTHPIGAVVLPTAAGWHQLLYATGGVMRTPQARRHDRRPPGVGPADPALLLPAPRDPRAAALAAALAADTGSTGSLVRLAAGAGAEAPSRYLTHSSASGAPLRATPAAEVSPGPRAASAAGRPR